MRRRILERDELKRELEELKRKNLNNLDRMD